MDKSISNNHGLDLLMCIWTGYSYHFSVQKSWIIYKIDYCNICNLLKKSPLRKTWMCHQIFLTERLRWRGLRNGLFVVVVVGKLFWILRKKWTFTALLLCFWPRGFADAVLETAYLLLLLFLFLENFFEFHEKSGHSLHC